MICCVFDISLLRCCCNPTCTAGAIAAMGAAIGAIMGAIMGVMGIIIWGSTAGPSRACTTGDRMPLRLSLTSAAAWATAALAA